MRKICVITGSRAEYGLLKPVIEAIREHPNLDLKLIVTGMHLSSEFGFTIKEIKKDRFKISKKIEMNPPEDSGVSMARSIGKGIIAMADAFNDIKPDFVLVLGDRIEALAGAISAAYQNIAVAHIHGGDSAKAGLDESVRHAVTKFAHVHFAATEKSAERISKLGEDSWRIHVTGALALDTILYKEFLSQEEFKKKFKIDMNKPLIILLQHSVTTEPEKAEMQIIETLEAVKELELQTIIIYPNSDAGGRAIIKQIKKYESLPFIKVYKNLSHIEYLSLLKYSSVLIGNSSSGIIESSSFKLPVVNIGIRQEGRERSTNVIDTNHERKEIIDAIKKVLYDHNFKERVRSCVNPYGEGKASKTIVDKLSSISLNKELIQKKNTY